MNLSLINSKTLSRSNDSLSSTKNDVNDDSDSSSSSSSNRSNRNHEVDDDNDDKNEVFVDEIDVFESSSLGEAFVFSTSLVVSLFSFVAARAKELKKLNINIIIQRVDANEKKEENENKNNNESNWVNEDEIMQETK